LTCGYDARRLAIPQLALPPRAQLPLSID
jgi:hypothetical protein